MIALSSFYFFFFFFSFLKSLHIKRERERTTTANDYNKVMTGTERRDTLLVGNGASGRWVMLLRLYAIRYREKSLFSFLSFFLLLVKPGLRVLHHLSLHGTGREKRQDKTRRTRGIEGVKQRDRERNKANEADEADA